MNFVKLKLRGLYIQKIEIKNIKKKKRCKIKEENSLTS